MNSPININHFTINTSNIIFLSKAGVRIFLVNYHNLLVN